MSETSDQPLKTRIVDGRLVDPDSVADTLRATLTAQPGLLRLEPTVRSALKRLKISSVNALHQTLRPNSVDPTVSSSDGLVLSLTDGVLNAHIDIATDIGHPALGLATTIQALAAEIVQRSGLTVGKIDVTILSIEGPPEGAPVERAHTSSTP